LCYLEDGASVWILKEWIDQTKKGELDQYLASRFGRNPNHPPSTGICSA